MAGYGWRPDGHMWIMCHSGIIPANAVHAGRDKDGAPIYAGRAYHEGALLPAKVVASHRDAYVCWDGAEIPKSEFEVLCGPPVAWQIASRGAVPPHAIPVGQTPEGEQLYIGRTFHDGSMTPGKIHPSHGVLYIPYGGEEVSKEEYEVMVTPPMPL
nr:PREDICTED: uncharacterized protein LOC109042558 [Bemisia tabaci]